MSVSTKKEFEEIIIEEMNLVAEDQGLSITESLVHDTVLLDSGLDSLAFAILVTALDDRLGWDPFAESTEAYYPVTLGEFIDFYWGFSRKLQQQ